MPFRRLYPHCDNEERVHTLIAMISQSRVFGKIYKHLLLFLQPDKWEKLRRNYLVIKKKCSLRTDCFQPTKVFLGLDLIHIQYTNRSEPKLLISITLDKVAFRNTHSSHAPHKEFLLKLVLEWALTWVFFY